MTIRVHDITHKKQKKAMDCWYACIQMLLTWQNGQEKTKPRGEAVKGHRNACAMALRRTAWPRPLRPRTGACWPAFSRRI
jgi:hypothetical protein